MTEKDIFLGALDHDDPARRAAYLDRACGGDAELRQRVEALLAKHDSPGGLLREPALRQMAAPGSATSAEVAGESGAIDLSFLQPPQKPGSLGRLSHYEIEEVLGRGGCGTVLKAFDEKLHRSVAVKVMAPELAATSPARKRFLREARAAAAVRHPNVVSIHAVEERPVPYLVMEHIAGQTLQQRIDATGPLDVPEVVSIGRQVASSLAAAHAEGLIHRDVKPANILLDGGDRVKLTDFGLARAADDASLTQSGTVSGTPLYMSPEQAQGETVDHRSDLFSLGSVLYVMCTGRPPFRGATSLAVFKRVVEDQPRPIREVIPEVPQWLIDVIARLHAKRPADRFASAQEVADALAASGAEPAATRPGRGRRWILVALLLAVSAGAAVTAGALLFWPDAASLAGAGESPAKESKPASADRRAAEYVLSLGGAVRVDGQEVDIRAADGLPVGPFRLTHVDLTGNQGVTDAGLAVFADCADLNTLWVGATPVSDAGLAHFKSCRRLRSIDVGETKVTGAGLLQLKGNQFEQAYLYGNPNLTDEGLAVFQDSKGLSVLQAHGSSFSDAGLAHFEGCRELIDLNLWSNNVTDEGVRFFRDCKGLRALTLGQTRVTDRGLGYFKGCEKLTWLNLMDLRIGEAGLANFSGCGELGLLALAGTDVTDAAVLRLKDQPGLWSLDLSRTPVSDEGLKKFQGCRRLKNLLLNETSVTDKGLACFRDCADLTDLQLFRTRVSDAGLAGLKACRSLALVYLGETAITDAALEQFRGSAALSRLDLYGADVTDKGLESLHDCRGLRHLLLTRTKVTLAGVGRARKSLPRCKIIWDGGTIEPTVVD